MTAYNVVRFRVKPGREKDFLDRMSKMGDQPPGSRKASVIKTGDRSYCVIGEWNAMSDIVAARPQMVGQLDSIRDFLEDLGGGMGLTDPVSGDVVAEMR